MDKKLIGITMGDPAGSGAEITVKALADGSVYDRCRPIVVGSASCVEKAASLVGHPEIKINPIVEVSEARCEFGTIDVLDMGLVDISKLEYGKVSAMCGEASFQYVKKVIELAMEGKIDATVTNAISKEAINLAGRHFSGHTEIYAHYTNTKSYCMMLMHGSLRVAHVSTHVSLREACDRCKKPRILEVIRLADEACRALGIEKPRVAVAGLNPHCGENCLFGTEERDEIAPAVIEARAEGLDVSGPIAPDTVFSKAIGGWYDIVVVMYHDQGHIPLKVKGFVYDRDKGEWEAVAGVNVTLGLPIIRASVDHGTAFGHAGHGNANELSLTNSIDCAITLADAGPQTVSYFISNSTAI